jgi:hypothetical protein
MGYDRRSLLKHMAVGAAGAYLVAEPHRGSAQSLRQTVKCTGHGVEINRDVARAHLAPGETWLR